MKFKRQVISILLSILMLLSVGCNHTAGEGTEEKVKIVTTAFPPYDFARQLAGEEAQVQMLLKPGSEAHNYEPTPQDMIAIQECDIFIYIGGEGEDWVAQVLDGTDNPKMQTLALMECVEGLEEVVIEGMYVREGSEHDHDHQEANQTTEDTHEHGEDCDHSYEDIEADDEHEVHVELDEHVWTSPVNVMEISKAITDCLKQAKPEQASYFEDNLQAYLQELTQLDATFKEIVEDGERDTLFFGDRFPFLYFAEEYGLSYYAAFPGCSSESEPSAATMIYLVDKIREENVPVVFTLALSSDKIADTLCEETGAKKLVLQDCHNIRREDFEAGETYLSLMKENAENIRIALQ